MFKEPWFRIIAVHEAKGPSIADIAVRVSDETGIPLAEMRGARQTRPIVKARRRVFCEARALRPDLSSEVIARYFNREGDAVRHAWRAA